LSMSDRIAVMSNGVIEQLDTPSEIYDRPRTAFVADFIGEMNFLDGDISATSAGEFDLVTRSGVVVRGRGDASDRKRARIGIRPARLSIVAGQAAGTVNTAKAVVDSKMYLGDEVQVVATLDGGTRMLIREQRAGTDDSHDAIRPGDPITIQWEQTAPVLLAESPDQAPTEGDTHE
jgi:ABC-type Fe3+/spermidine/putrescine transport system ATPase subunit